MTVELPQLAESEVMRYDRQMRIYGWGMEGQRKLKAARVVVAGIGGLGCTAAMLIAASGIGRIVLIDKGRFELSNLNRQLLGWNKDIGMLKVEAAKEKLKELNPEVEVEAIAVEIGHDNVAELIRGSDVVIDGMDNWRARLIINDACVRYKIPFVHAGLMGTYGQATTIVPGIGPCLRCLIPHPPPERPGFPVTGPIPSMLASIEAMEAIKLIVGIGRPLIGRMIFIDLEEMTFESVEVKKNSSCAACSSKTAKSRTSRPHI